MKLSAKDLVSIIESNDVETLKKYGGIKSISKTIQSSSPEERISLYGSNVIPVKASSPFQQLLLEALKDQTLLILIFCSILSLVLEVTFSKPEEIGAWIDGAAILLAVAVVSNVQALSNFHQEKQFAALNRIKNIFPVVVEQPLLNKNQQTELTQKMSNEVLVGDIVVIETGNKIPADGILIESDSITIEQSLFTGETIEASKDEKNDPFLIGGTFVVEGKGKLFVLAVGRNTQQGKMFSILKERDKTPLQEKLENLAKQIGVVGIVVASITFGILCLRWILAQENIFSGDWGLY
jgi:Ca2+-transporting ATPase